MTDFSIQGIMNMIAQVAFGGDLNLAGLAVMVVCFFICVMILASVRAPVTYAVVPMIPIAILFTAMGVLNTSMGFLIIIVTALITAVAVRNIVTNERG